MYKVILLTGATDGIGFEAAKTLASQGHHLLLHGRNPAKLSEVQRQLVSLTDKPNIETYVADFSRLDDVSRLAGEVLAKHKKLDVLINNAGIFRASAETTVDGLDLRFAVNTVAPYLLTRKLLPLMGPGSRVINVSSAAQAEVSLAALKGQGSLEEFQAYSQSKLALNMWTNSLAARLPANSPLLVSVNPASMLGTKMVREGFGAAGGDIRIGSDILCKAGLSEEFSNSTGKYFDNDKRAFADPHPDALNSSKNDLVVQTLDTILSKYL